MLRQNLKLLKSQKKNDYAFIDNKNNFLNKLIKKNQIKSKIIKINYLKYKNYFRKIIIFTLIILVIKKILALFLVLLKY